MSSVSDNPTDSLKNNNIMESMAVGQGNYITNEASKLFIGNSQNFKKTFLAETKYSKGFERSFLGEPMDEVAKMNGQMCENSLLSFIKIVHQINTQIKIKK